MEQDRIATVTEWPQPNCVRHILTFNGFANFYRRFIKDYSKIIDL